MAMDPMRNLTIWMAPNIGMVKMELAEGFRIIEKFEIWELIEYYPPD